MAVGAMVALPSTFLPSRILEKEMTLDFSLFIRLLDGVKNPNEARFFSIFTKSAWRDFVSVLATTVEESFLSPTGSLIGFLVSCSALARSRPAMRSSKGSLDSGIGLELVFSNQQQTCV